MNLKEIQHVLEKCEFFKGLEKGHVEKIARLCQLETYAPGDYVFRQGDFGEYLYIIIEGHVYLERAVDLDTRKGNVLIGILGRGRVLGCWSTLLDEPHHLMSSALCQKPTRLLSIRGSDLRGMMMKDHRFGLNILERLCFLLRDRIQWAYGAMEKI
ncbi:MAG: cyclic nucleotide-binding domain-containing protein [Pseudomonadota bacterium]